MPSHDDVLRTCYNIARAMDDISLCPSGIAWGRESHAIMYKQLREFEKRACDLARSIDQSYNTPAHDEDEGNKN